MRKKTFLHFVWIISGLSLTGCSFLLGLQPGPPAYFPQCIVSAANDVGAAYGDRSYSFSTNKSEGAYQIHLQSDSSQLAMVVLGPYGNREGVVSIRDGVIAADYAKFYSLPILLPDILFSTLLLSREEGMHKRLTRACNGEGRALSVTEGWNELSTGGETFLQYHIVNSKERSEASLHFVTGDQKNIALEVLLTEHN